MNNPDLIIIYFWSKDFNMITFNELRLSDNRKNLIVDCVVDDAYKDLVYISGIYLEYYANASALGSISDKAYTIWENTVPDESIISKRAVVPDAILPTSKLGVSTFVGGMFYVIVKCEAKTNLNAAGLAQLAALASSSCDSDTTTDVGIVLDWNMVYNNGMQYVSAMAVSCDTCELPVGYEEFILIWYGLRLALSTCDTSQAAMMWDRFLRMTVGKTTPISGCGCK